MRSNGFKVIRTRARPISARVASVGVSVHRISAVGAGVIRKRNRDWVHMSYEHFDEMQLHDFLI